MSIDIYPCRALTINYSSACAVVDKSASQTLFYPLSTKPTPHTTKSPMRLQTFHKHSL